MEIPYNLLTDTALAGLIEEFVTREGTEYGHGDHAVEGKISQVMRQLDSGRAAVVYDEATGTCNIIPKGDNG